MDDGGERDIAIGELIEKQVAFDEKRIEGIYVVYKTAWVFRFDHALSIASLVLSLRILPWFEIRSAKLDRQLYILPSQHRFTATFNTSNTKTLKTE